MLFSLCTSIRLLQPSLAGCAPRSQVPPPWNLSQHNTQEEQLWGLLISYLIAVKEQILIQ